MTILNQLQTTKTTTANFTHNNFFGVFMGYKMGTLAKKELK